MTRTWPQSSRAQALAASALTVGLILTAFERASAQTGIEAAAADGGESTLNVPTNAYATNVGYGRGWECEFGFLEAEGGCALIVLPSDAHLDSYGERWRCDRGYRAADDACVAIPVPENGYLNDDTLGLGWECERGYRPLNGACAALRVPANGYLKAASPYGRGWACERGYRVVAETCEAVVVPANAHINRAGDGWDCNRPYRRSSLDACELR